MHEDNKLNTTFDINEFFSFVLSKKKSLIIISVLFFFIGLVASLIQPTKYHAKLIANAPEGEIYTHFEDAYKPLESSYTLDFAHPNIHVPLSQIKNNEFYLTEFISLFNNKEHLSLYLEEQSKVSVPEKLQAFIDNADESAIAINITPYNDSSLNFINEYVSFTNNQLEQNLVENINDEIEIRKETLQSEAKRVSFQTKITVLSEIEKTKVALQVAENAGLDKPMDFISNGFIDFELGTDILKQKLKTMSDIYDNGNFDLVSAQLLSRHQLLDIIDDANTAGLSENQTNIFTVDADSLILVKANKLRSFALPIITLILGLCLFLAYTLFAFISSKKK